MADRLTTPWAVIVDDDGWAYEAETRESAISQAEAHWGERWACGDWDGGEVEVTLYMGVTWLLRSDDPRDDEWAEHAPYVPEWDQIIIATAGGEIVTLRATPDVDPHCPTCGGSGIAETTDGEADDCPRGCGEDLVWSEVTDE